jgi:hypothetical protein
VRPTSVPRRLHYLRATRRLSTVRVSAWIYAREIHYINISVGPSKSNAARRWEVLSRDG